MKRLFDILLAAVLLVLLSPVLALTALAVLLRDGRPILFRQVRPGLHGRPFRVVKFRTMAPDTGPDLDSSTMRVTKLGATLRSTSLDELPELWNVLKGEMSFVGPRPLLMEYLPLYSAEQSRRHDVRPGITGWAQINGRNAVSWPRKLALDIWYVDNRSMLLDIRILWLTALKVLRRDDVDHDAGMTMPKFTGRETE